MQVLGYNASVTNGSAVVTDIDATFVTDLVAAGHGFTVVDSGVSYTIASVDSETQITLSANYAGTTDTVVYYAIFNAFTSPDGIPELGKGDVETATIYTRAMRKIQDLITTAGSALAAHLADTTDAHAASAITNTPAGDIVATDVQAAIDELDTEKQPVDATLTSLSSLGTAADKYAYTTGVDTWAEGDISAFGRSIIDDADEATFKATVNLEIGTDVQAYDATLTALAGGLTAANKVPYATAIDTLGELDFKDEDNMASDSATALVSQQSIKVFVERMNMRGNAVINGGCLVAQRTAPNISGSYQYGQVDRFACAADGTPTAGTIAQAETTLLGTSGFASHISGLSTGAGGTAKTRYRIESKDVRHFVNQAAIFHCNVYHDAGSAVDYTITINKANAQDDFSAVTQIATSAAATSVSSATPTQISLAVADMASCANGVEIVVSAACGAVTTKNFYTNEWQIELGTYTTDFWREYYADELLRCQRYAWKISDDVTYTGFGVGATSTTTQADLSVTPPVVMRTTPTLTVTNVSNFRISDYAAQYTPSAIAIYALVCTPTVIALTATIAGATAYRPVRLEGDGTANNSSLLFEAEL